MEINKNADLRVLLEHGWKSFEGGKQICYYKDFSSSGAAEIAIIINPLNQASGDFVVNSFIEDEIEHDDSSANMYEILEEIELLKKLKILIF